MTNKKSKDEIDLEIALTRFNTDYPLTDKEVYLIRKAHDLNNGKSKYDNPELGRSIN